MALEENCDVDIPDEDAKRFRTVKDVLDYIERQRKTQKRKKGNHLN